LRIVDIIERKRAGIELSKDEIEAVVSGFVKGNVPDYQVSAWLMAVCWRGMTRREVFALTRIMVDSGTTLDFSRVALPVVDKHSSGGVGDKTTLVVAPLVRACGAAVGKMSGRGLGFTGGTLDKLEAIPGYRTDLSVEEFVRQLSDIGIVVSGQTIHLAPADGKIYALRDVTATVASLPLIASSIMSKKLAIRAQGLVLDVKVGSGAFMAGVEDARELAKLMVEIGASEGRRVSALLTPMDQPLGLAVGNALEVAEAIDALKGNGPEDLVDLSIMLAGEMLALARVASDPESGRRLALEALRSGQGLEWLQRLIAAQGGNPRVVDDPGLMGRAPLVEQVKAPRPGYVSRVDALGIARAALGLGAGREAKDDRIDPAVGVALHAKTGMHLSGGDLLAEVHARDASSAQKAAAEILQAYTITGELLAAQPFAIERYSTP
jgi:pyrimidine-nucleoside phosphorylase